MNRVEKIGIKLMRYNNKIIKN